MVIVWDTETINVAVHIRRGDIAKRRDMALPISYYTTVMNQIEETYVSKDKTVRFHVFSDVSKSFWRWNDRDLLYQLGDDVKSSVEFHVDETMQVSFHTLVVADVLIMSRSEFSYAAALLNPHEVHYTRKPLPIDHIPPSHWILHGETGDVLTTI